MTSINQAKVLADRLGKYPIFRNISINEIRRGEDYRIFIRVPAHCISVDGVDNAAAKNDPKQIIDLLICRGSNAILAVVFDIEHTNPQKLFSVCFSGLPHHILNPDEMIEDVEAALCEEIHQQLRDDRQEPSRTGYKLRPLHLASAVLRMKSQTIADSFQSKAIAFLQEKHLVYHSGAVTNYGRACGLFQQYIAAGEGRTKYVTTGNSVASLHRAMAWCDVANANHGLASRLYRLKQGLPVDAILQHRKTIQSLLDMPLDKLFVKYEQDLHHLNLLLSKAQYLSAFSKVSAFGDKEEIRTYGDVLYAVRNLWEYTAQRDCRNAEVGLCCEQILAFLSFPLWSLPCEKAPTSGSYKRKSLQARLNREAPNKLTSLLMRIPLKYYFYVAASLTECEYPIWLYTNRIAPWLEIHDITRPGFVTVMNAVYNLSQSDDEDEQTDYFPLMYNILVEPFTGIV